MRKKFMIIITAMSSQLIFGQTTNGPVYHFNFSNNQNGVSGSNSSTNENFGTNDSKKIAAPEKSNQDNSNQDKNNHDSNKASEELGSPRTFIGFSISPSKDSELTQTTYQLKHYFLDSSFGLRLGYGNFKINYNYNQIDLFDAVFHGTFYQGGLTYQKSINKFLTFEAMALYETGKVNIKSFREYQSPDFVDDTQFYSEFNNAKYNSGVVGASLMGQWQNINLGVEFSKRVALKKDKPNGESTYMIDALKNESLITLVAGFRF